jgi:hypothetical protein
MTEQSAIELEIRTLAASAYNSAFEAVEAGNDPLFALELAAASLHLWCKVGNDQNLAIGYWLYSRALIGAQSFHLAIEAAVKSLSHLSVIDSPADWLVASVNEGWARALYLAGDLRSEDAIARTKELIAEIADPEDRTLIATQFASLKES